MNIPTGFTGATQTPERTHRYLEGEAVRVARGMASFRNERVRRLSEPSAALAMREDSRDSQKPAQKNGGAGFSPFYYYPFLFATAFPSVRADALHTLALANRILLEAILLVDKKIDEGRPWTPADFYLMDGYFQRALEMLIPLFPLEHDFWQGTQECYLQHGRAILKEQARHHGRLCPYTRDEFFELATGKVALIKTNLLAMGSLAGTSAILPPLMESQDHFLAGFQCFDDLRDWKEDLLHGNFTFLLTRVLSEGPFQGKVRQGDSIPRDDVGQVLYHGGFAQEQLHLAEQYLLSSLDTVKDIHVPNWTRNVRGFLRHCRTMRHDLKEIRRRTTRGAEPKQIQSCLETALGFLVRPTYPLAGPSLAQSENPYMSPSIDLTPSRFVATYLLSALSPLQNMDSRLSRLLRKASNWLTTSSERPTDPSLPAALEESFPPLVTDTGALLELDADLDQGLPQHPRGLFWANLLSMSSRVNVRLPKLEQLARASIQRADYTQWTHLVLPESHETSDYQGVCHPLLVLLFFCQYFGSDPLGTPLREYLLRRNRATGAWNHPTEIALRVLCLISIGYQGSELSPAVDKLIRTQEPNGSWPPNALYEEQECFYGSRDLTTAWCLLALFLYHLGPGPPQVTRTPPPISAREAPDPGIVLHSGLPGRFLNLARSALDDLRIALAPQWPNEFYIGSWAGMPPHFLLKTEQGILAGINTLPHKRGKALSTGNRQLKVEVLMATILARRCLEQGSLKDRLERIFVAGLALSMAGRLWPGLSPWRRLGMRRLDWSWCCEHEAFLWEELRRFLLHPSRGNPAFGWLLPDHRASPTQPIPAGAALFLGESLLAEPVALDDPFQKVNGLLGKSRPDILRTFRRKVGLESDENAFS